MFESFSYTGESLPLPQFVRVVWIGEPETPHSSPNNRLASAITLELDVLIMCGMQKYSTATKTSFVVLGLSISTVIVFSVLLALDFREDKKPIIDTSGRCLLQADFVNGTLLIDEPGTYKLCEDVTFGPLAPMGNQTPAEAYDVHFEGIHNRSSFGLGYFAAIAVIASNVTINLNGYTLEQSVEHSLMQRYFALIELANTPFIEGTGPAQFVSSGESFQCSSDLRILGPGTLGRSSHHGIHGNENNNVEIRNVTFRDFEVAAVALNNVDGLIIEECHVEGNRHDVPVNGLLSAARFIRPYGALLKQKGYEMVLRGHSITVDELYDRLITAINNVCSDVVHGTGTIDSVAHSSEYELFNNPLRVIDGPCYAFLVNGRGPAVGGQGYDFVSDPSAVSSNVVIQNNHIKDVKCWNKEIPAVVVDGKVQNDARGSVLQFVDLDGTGISITDDGHYKGNVVADVQIMVAKAIHEGVLEDTPLLQTTTNTIDPSIVAWAESGNGILSPRFRCNGDSMHHVIKGMIIIRVEETEGFDIRGNTIENVQNLSPLPFSPCSDFNTGASWENALEQQSGNVRGISVAATRSYPGRASTIDGNRIHHMESENGSWIVGIDIQGDASGIEIEGNEVNVKDGVMMSEKYLALRIRAHVDGSSVVVGDENMFYQQAQDLSTSRRLRPAPKIPPHETAVDSDYGSCPFAGILWQP